jgi:hypothetical protein
MEHGDTSGYVSLKPVHLQIHFVYIDSCHMVC